MQGVGLTGHTGTLTEATYAVMIRPGEEIVAGSNERFRVVAVVRFDEEDGSPFVGLLQVEARSDSSFPLFPAVHRRLHPSGDWV